MNLWRRGSRFTFQKRVPSDLVSVLGATPIRVVLPRCGRRQADRLAALLDGTAEAIFQLLRLGMRDTEEDPRDAVIREVQEYLREAEHALAISEKLRRIEVEHVERACLMERLEEQQDMRERLQRLRAPMKRIQEGLREIRQQQRERKVAGSAADAAASVLAQVQEQLAHLKSGDADSVLPHLSKKFPEYIAHQRKELATPLQPEGSKDARYTLGAASRAFLDIVGDCPLSDYRPKDLQEFARVLARVEQGRQRPEGIRAIANSRAREFMLSHPGSGLSN